MLAEQKAETPPPHPDSSLPHALDATTLADWGVSVQYRELLQSCRTEGELLALEGRVPGDTIDAC